MIKCGAPKALAQRLEHLRQDEDERARLSERARRALRGAAAAAVGVGNHPRR